MIYKMLRICRFPLLHTCHNHFAITGASIQLANKQFSTINNTEPKTISEIVKHWSNKFEHEGISEPVESIEHILAHVLGTKKIAGNNYSQCLTAKNLLVICIQNKGGVSYYLRKEISHPASQYQQLLLQIMDLLDEPERRLSHDQITKLQSLCECRMSRMPVQYIIGEWDFRDITLKMVPPVFIPRPETEILVDIILSRIASMKNEIFKVLDIGCGSGAISLALVHANSKIHCTSIDKSLYACDLTRENAEILGLRDNLKILNAVLRENGTVKFVKSVESAAEFEEKQFDIIVSNPPYVPTAKVMDLAPEIRIYEDLRALDGGKDGLNLVKAVMKYASKALVPEGLLFMEVDPGHPEYIEFFSKKYSDFKLCHDHTYKDYCNNERFVELSKLK